ncbi:tumor necrosis factor receptor superfamily member 19-like [Lethenteron reissneri]|uniref:tumor necrosis factor receptor superfamily member 19-like n=1 Tax=Lethenteron reissneri TaxID=7753 RepID=UPI002AB73265|nr:tumor necrosis factor receptor superfamily member 19-like [Lethenteron reissneri]
MALHLSPAPSPDHRPHHHHHHHHHHPLPPPPPLLLLLLAASAVALSSGRAEAQEAGGHPGCPLGEETPAEGVRYPACRCGVEFARPLPEEILPADPASRREQGYHRDEAGGWYYCRRCRDCALGGRVMLAGCSRARDAVCGGCARPGARYDARVLACVPDEEHQQRGGHESAAASSTRRVENITEQVIEVLLGPRDVVRAPWFAPALCLAALAVLLLTGLALHMRLRGGGAARGRCATCGHA